MLLSKGPSRCKNLLLLLVFAFVLLLCWPTTYTVSRLVSSHVYDLNYPSIFRSQFRVYVLTHACGRFTPNIASTFDSVVLVPDGTGRAECATLNQTQLVTAPRTDGSADEMYRHKYLQVLEDCQNGDKMKCLILEDDVVLLHDLTRTRQVLVENTMALFNNEDSAYDCTKRGFGWLRTTPTGNGSQCRIFSKPSTACMIQCLSEDGSAQLDYGLKRCQVKCRLTQKRFLLAVHGGLKGTIDRGQG